MKSRPVSAIPGAIPILGQKVPRNIRPVHDWVVLKQVKGETVTDAGVIIPETKQVHEAEVIAVGPGRWHESGELIPVSCKVGDRVLLDGDSRVHMVDGEYVFTIRDMFIIGIVEPRPREPEPARELAS